MRSIAAASSGLCLALLVAAVPAKAALTAAELALDEAVLNQFNVVTFSNYDANNETEGRVAVGGDFTGGNHNVCFNGCGGDTTSSALGATYGSLNVWGSVSGGATSGGGNFYIQGNNAAGSTLQMQHNGGVGIAGTNYGQINSPTFVTTTAGSAGSAQNASNVSTGQAASTAFPLPTTMPFQGALTDLATSIAADAAAASRTQTLGANGNNTTIDAATTSVSYGGKTYSFITTTMADLASQQNFGGVNANGLDAVFVVVTGTSTAALPNLNGNYNETNVIWDFVDATTLNFAGGWYGQILAPDATVTNPSGVLTGAVIANSIVQGGEIHQDTGGYFLPTEALNGLPTTGSQPVDEPSTIGVLLAGLLGLVMLRRRVARD